MMAGTVPYDQSRVSAVGGGLRFSMSISKTSMLLLLLIGMSSANKRQNNYTMDVFKEYLGNAKHVLILTGAGVSAESGVPTFRGKDGLWRHFRAEDLATLNAFKKSPSLVWEFYHYRRELVRTRKPNKAHYAIAEFEKRILSQGRKFTLITQNVDGLHKLAGSQNIIELHGSIFKTKCMECDGIRENFDSPICPALKGKGAPDLSKFTDIPESELPRCGDAKCGGLLRPGVIWFNEQLDPIVLKKAEEAISSCDICLVVGTSSVVYPAANFAPSIAERGIPVAEFNLEFTPCSAFIPYQFRGPCTQTIPKVLSVE